MKQKKLIDVVQRLNKKEILRYASNLGCELDGNKPVKDLRRAYSEYVLANPKEILERLPNRDLDIISLAINAKSPDEVRTLDLHQTLIMEQYGLADAEDPRGDIVIVDIPKDLCDALSPHIQWAFDDPANQMRMTVEVAIDGLANVLGIVNQETITDLLKTIDESDDEEKVKKYFNQARQYSLLLDSMEWAEDKSAARDEDLLFVSRFGWEDLAKMKQYIDTRSKNIKDIPDFDVDGIMWASANRLPVLPNERGKEFFRYLTEELGFDTGRAYLILFNLWYFKTRRGEYDETDDPLEIYFLRSALGEMPHEPSDQQAEEAMERMTDYVNHLPLWSVAGHTADEYPSEAFVRRLSTEKPVGPMMRKLRKQARALTDILNGKIPTDMSKDMLAALFPRLNSDAETPAQPYLSPAKVGRNDPCPCGSGRKYKHCCGKA